MNSPQEQAAPEVAPDPSEIIARFSKLRPRLVAYANSILHNKEQAEDFVSDVLANLLAKPDLWANIIADAFFYKCVRNLVLNYIRDTRRHAERLEHEYAFHEDHSPNPELEYTQGETRVALDRVLGLLTEPHQEILRLRHQEELSYVEIAERLGLKLGTVMSRLFRAHEQLKKCSAALRD